MTPQALPRHHRLDRVVPQIRALIGELREDAQRNDSVPGSSFQQGIDEGLMMAKTQIAARLEAIIAPDLPEPSRGKR